jgi:hypothetical protein
MQDGTDCAPLDAGVFAPPQEVTGLGFGSDHEALTWDSALPGAGPDTTHDLLRGAIEELPLGFGPSESCVAMDLEDAGGRR